MTDYTQFKKDVLQMRKDKHPLATVAVFHLAEISGIGKNNGNTETSNDQFVQYIKKTCQKLGDTEHHNPAEREFICQYMPKMATEEEVKAFVAGLDTSNKGAAMKVIKDHFGVNVDMKMASKLV